MPPKKLGVKLAGVGPSTMYTWEQIVEFLNNKQLDQIQMNETGKRRFEEAMKTVETDKISEWVEENKLSNPSSLDDDGNVKYNIHPSDKQYPLDRKIEHFVIWTREALDQATIERILEKEYNNKWEWVFQAGPTSQETSAWPQIQVFMQGKEPVC